MFRFSVLCIFSAIVSAEGLTMSWGHLRPRNLLMFDQLFQQKSGESGETLDFSSKLGLLITAIHVTDLTLQQNGGQVKILQGGIGFNFVKFQLKPDSERQRLLLNIEIFGDLK